MVKLAAESYGDFKASTYNSELTTGSKSKKQTSDWKRVTVFAQRESPPQPMAKVGVSYLSSGEIDVMSRTAEDGSLTP